MNKNILRSIFWGFLSLVCLALGILGLINSNKLFNEKKDDLIKLTETFNNSNLVNTYKKASTEITASLKGKNITINYSGVAKKKYTYKLKNGYLETKINKNDETASLLLMVLADSISVNLGSAETSTYPLFNDGTVMSYKLEDGIEYKEKNNYYIVKINIDSPIYIYNSPDNNYNNY